MMEKLIINFKKDFYTNENINIDFYKKIFDRNTK